MQNQLMVVGSSLSPLETLTEDSVRQVMGLLDEMSLTRVIVTDDEGVILYDTAGPEGIVGEPADIGEITTALNGYDIFNSVFTSDAFESSAAVPIMYKNSIIGAVYFYEYDPEQAELILGLLNNLMRMSIAIGAVCIGLIFIFSTTITGRIKNTLRAIKTVSEGRYEYQMELKGNDELTELGHEFNNLAARLQTTEEIRRRFVSDASHELKTPLASIRLLSDSILQNEEIDRDTVREFVYDIGNEAERLARITQKLLSLTRLDSRVEAERERVDVKAVVEESLRMMKPLADAREISLIFSASGDCFVKATKDDLYQIIFNLVENGIKYNVRDGSVFILLYEDRGMVSLIVDDTGIGIPEEDMPNVFDRFYRVDKARSREAGGSGLGLSIVKDTVLTHGGTVEVSPREQGGTRFKVSFPLAADE